MSFAFPSPISVSDLCIGVEARITAPNVSVKGISQDSRNVREGDIYCCVRGANFDGHSFVMQAIAAGAVAVLIDTPVPGLDSSIAVVEVADVRTVLGVMASNGFQHPSASLTLVGITGTNGKTSTAAILASILEANGNIVDVYGTLSGERTTPEAIELQSRLRTSLDNGCTHVVMEVSSHALHQGRVSGITFDAAVLTNIARDHLDYHGTEENYFAAKAMLFSPGQSRVGVVNVDDPRGQLLVDVGGIPMRTFSAQDISNVELSVNRVSYVWNEHHVVVPMGGNFTVLNSLAAVTAADELGISVDAIIRGCAALKQVSGRFESVDNKLGIGVVVDYAHTADGLSLVLQSARALTSQKLIVVFGCGGNRDHGKRPVMGAIAAERADEVIVTSDNPRMENPEQIVEEILSGVPESARNRVVVELDRAKAIASAISRAVRGDIVVIAGKGHEQTQEVNGVLAPFSDVDVAAMALQDRKGDAS